MTTRLITLLFITVLSACSGLPYQSQPPAAALQTVHTIAPSPLSEHTSHTLQTLNAAGDIFYFQNFGADLTTTTAVGTVIAATGTAIAPLLGPIGEAYITAEVEARTEADVAELKDKITLNPQIMLRQALLNPTANNSLIRLSTDSTNSTDAIKISPFIYIVKTENNDLLFSLSIFVQDPTIGDKTWQGKYTYQLPVRLAKSDLLAAAEKSEQQLAPLFADAMQRVIELYQSDRAAQLTGKEEVSLTSEFFSPRFGFKVSAEVIYQNTKELVIRASNGVYSLPVAFTEVH